MTARRKSALRIGDWVKLMVVLAVALIGFSYVYSVYTEPFDLTAEIVRQRQYQDYESTSPLVRKIPYRSGGPPVELLPQPGGD